MTTIDIDGLSEEEFRRSIEARLRKGLAGKAVEKLRALIEPYAGPGAILPERFLTVAAKDLTLGGWDALGDALRRHDRPGRPVTAVSIAFGWPGEDVPQPDGNGHLSPLIETGYYSDDAFPFSQSDREDLLEGYSYHGCTWTGDCEATDTGLWLTGIDDLQGALAGLEARLLASEEPDEDGIRAGSLGACLLSALLYQAVEARIAQSGLPRPLCVMAGSSGVYPYFDAPVAGFPEDARKAAEAAEDEPAVDTGVPGPRYSSLLVTGIPRARKRAVLVLAETADEEAARIARLRGLAHGEPAELPPLPEPPLRSDGTIASAPDSPLLVKKPSGQSWDFRDMLGPRDPQAPGADLSPPDFGADWDEPETDGPEPSWNADAPVDREPDEPVAAPAGFDAEWDDALPEDDWTEAESPEAALPVSSLDEPEVAETETIEAADSPDLAAHDEPALRAAEPDPLALEPEWEPGQAHADGIAPAEAEPLELQADWEPEPALAAEVGAESAAPDAVPEPANDLVPLETALAASATTTPAPIADEVAPRFPAPAWGTDLRRDLGPGWNDFSGGDASPLPRNEPLPEAELEPEWREAATNDAEPADDAQPEPTAELTPDPLATEVEPVARPGFSLFESLAGERQRSLFTLPIFQKKATAEVSPPVAAPAPDQPASWAHGLAWRAKSVEDASDVARIEVSDEPVEPPIDDVPHPAEPPVTAARAPFMASYAAPQEEPRPKGILAGIRAWWLGQR